MARGINEIQKKLEEEVQKNLPQLGSSTSATAEWRLWTFVMASLCHVSERLMDQFRGDINRIVDEKRLGSASWYVHIAKEFQLSDELSVSEEGILKYPSINKEKCIIAHASFKEEGEEKDKKLLFLRVAKAGKEAGTFAPLDKMEEAMFKAYLEKVKLAGTEIQVVSIDSDRLQVDLLVYHDHLFEEDKVREKLIQAIKDYCAYGLGETGVLVRNDLLEKMRHSQGVQDVEIKKLTAWSEGMSTEITPQMRVYTTKSGHIQLNETDEKEHPSNIILK